MLGASGETVTPWSIIRKRSRSTRISPRPTPVTRELRSTFGALIRTFCLLPTCRLPSARGHLWAERYDGAETDLFALQDKVIGEIVSALSVKLTALEETQLARKPTENLEAYDYYLRAEGSRHIGGIRGNTDALVNYQKAIALDPNFAEAYAGDGKALGTRRGTRLDRAHGFTVAG